MLTSMTGYGIATAGHSGLTVTIEMKSVNNRYFDIDFSMPKPLGYLEEPFRTMIHQQIKRGKVNVNVTVDGASVTETKLDIDWNLLEQYQLHMRLIAEKYKVPDGWNVTEVLKLPGVLKQVEDTQRLSTYEPLFRTTLNQALEQLVKMRMNEGQNLENDLCERLTEVLKLIKEIRQWVPHVLDKYQTRLVNKINEFLDGRFQLDEARLMNEVAVYADKSDISEELLRLDSHVQQFFDIIEENEPKGRKLDFLVQEMNREINTIGSKSNDATISRHVVAVKSELEKIREQVQNIE